MIIDDLLWWMFCLCCEVEEWGYEISKTQMTSHAKFSRLSFFEISSTPYPPPLTATLLLFHVNNNYPRMR